MPVSKLVFIFVPVRELVWFPNSDWRVYLSFHSGSISAQTEILVWELGPSAQTGINESQFANWDPSSRTGTVRILGLTYILKSTCTYVDASYMYSTGTQLQVQSGTVVMLSGTL